MKRTANNRTATSPAMMLQLKVKNQWRGVIDPERYAKLLL